MKLSKVLLILSIILVSLGSALIIAGAILTLLGRTKLGDIFITISSVIGIAAMALLIYRLVVMSKTPELYNTEKTKVVVKIVDVKDIPKTKEEKLYEQYEDLYKKNLISKEDLDKKRLELLGK